MITNFPYKYLGIKSTVLPVEKTYSETKVDCSHKIKTLNYLFDMRFFKEDELYWYHDLDAYQLEPITESELNLKGLDAGFCDYQRNPKWQMGSFFFRKSARPIFKSIYSYMEDSVIRGQPLNDEDTMVYLTNNNIDNINKHIKRLNGRYDFGMRRVTYCWDQAKKPLKVLHFHPNNPTINTLAIAMYGKNRIGKPLMNDRLIKLFHEYGYS